jgi:hypothetical protein
MLASVGRIAFRADAELEQRLQKLVDAAHRSPELRHLGVTVSNIARSAILNGLPFLELKWTPEVAGDDFQTTEDFLQYLYRFALEQAELRGIKLTRD